ncbi:hypothetical protein, partial [Piscinibacter sp.]|uniref:hypothetical protein n=1 Tax=Piscinibacter sp. TaxID=1903157 RepID=UPI002BF65FEB
MKQPSLFLCLAVMPLLLHGCGVTLESRHVANSKPSTLVAGEGIVYALPKTEFQVVQPIKLSVSTSGFLQGVFESCSQACDAGTTTACSYSNKPSVGFAVPQLRTVAVADMSRLYQIAAGADLFQTLDFKFDIGQDGVLQSADGSATNEGYEVLASVAKGVLKIGASAPSAPSVTPPATAPRVTADSCHDASRGVAELAREQKNPLQCSLVGRMKACLAQRDQHVDEEQAKLHTLYEQAAKQKTPIKLLAALSGHQRERIAAAKARRDLEIENLGLTDSPPVHATYDVVLPMQAPPEFDKHEFALTLGEAVKDGSARILGTSDNAQLLLPRLTEALVDDPRHFHIASTMPDSVTKSSAKEADVVGKGYRYRVPMLSPTTLTVYANKDKKETVVGPMIDHKIIAQYGPIASLPSHFKGKKGRVHVKHWPDTGGIQHVEIGA